MTAPYPKTIWLATWDHKHGQDVSAHLSESSARKQCVAWMRGCLNANEWRGFLSPDEEERYKSLNDTDLFNAWGEITAYTEFMSVVPIALHA
tara:strand:- start:75 stop:350 length:276 start_codon:yes stop_codon:yes gene_type:complete